jgi:hypothetical protein
MGMRVFQYEIYNIGGYVLTVITATHYAFVPEFNCFTFYIGNRPVGTVEREKISGIKIINVMEVEDK